MNTQQQMEERLWSYIDGFSEADERSAIEKLLESNVEWQSKYKELLDVHQLLIQTELEEPSLRFTRNVMEEIAKFQIAPATKNYINKKIINTLGAFFVTMVVGFLIYGFAQLDWSAATSGNTTVLPVDFGKLDFSRFFSNTYVNILIMINIVLGLMLLDRYLTKKKNEALNSAKDA